MKKQMKNVGSKIMLKVIRIIPIIVPVLLSIHANSTASFTNGQPIPPKNLRKYRRF